MSHPASPQLDFWSLLFDPLVTIEEARFLLDEVSDKHVAHLVEEGRLSAINIALDLSGGKRLLRVYAFSIHALAMSRTRKLPKAPVSIPVEHLLPHTRPNLLKREVENLLKCSPDHVANLFAGALRQLGTGGSRRLPRIPREALLSFLQAREVA